MCWQWAVNHVPPNIVPIDNETRYEAENHRRSKLADLMEDYEDIL